MEILWNDWYMIEEHGSIFENKYKCLSETNALYIIFLYEKNHAYEKERINKGFWFTDNRFYLRIWSLLMASKDMQYGSNEAMRLNAKLGYSCTLPEIVYRVRLESFMSRMSETHSIVCVPFLLEHYFHSFLVIFFSRKA